MNENINLYEILKDRPKGTILWCPAMGIVTLSEVSKSDDFPIVVKSEDNHYHYFTKKGTLQRDNISDKWHCGLFSFFNDPMLTHNLQFIVPYNDDTKHLVGTSDEAPEYYRYWED